MQPKLSICSLNIVWLSFILDCFLFFSFWNTVYTHFLVMHCMKVNCLIHVPWVLSLQYLKSIAIGLKGFTTGEDLFLLSLYLECNQCLTLSALWCVIIRPVHIRCRCRWNILTPWVLNILFSVQHLVLHDAHQCISLSTIITSVLSQCLRPNA